MTTAIIDRPKADEGPAWWFLDLLVLEHRCAPEMATVVLEATLPVGSSAPLHVHQHLDDTWYIIDGEMVLRCGEDISTVAAGHWVSMPRGVPHTFRVVGHRDARILLVHDNSSFRDFVRELAVPAGDRVPPPQPVYPSPEQLALVAQAFDIRPVGPPISLEEADTALLGR